MKQVVLCACMLQSTLLKSQLLPWRHAIKFSISNAEHASVHLVVQLMFSNLMHSIAFYLHGVQGKCACG